MEDQYHFQIFPGDLKNIYGHEFSKSKYNRKYGENKQITNVIIQLSILFLRM
jgi:hypothetical protein